MARQPAPTLHHADFQPIVTSHGEQNTRLAIGMPAKCAKALALKTIRELRNSCIGVHSGMITTIPTPADTSLGNGVCPALGGNLVRIPHRETKPRRRPKKIGITDISCGREVSMMIS